MRSSQCVYFSPEISGILLFALLCPIVPTQAGPDSSESCLQEFLKAYQLTSSDPPSTAEITDEIFFFAVAPSLVVKPDMRRETKRFILGGVRVRDGWHFRYATPQSAMPKGEDVPSEWECWKRKRTFLRAEGQGFKSISEKESVPIDLEEVLKDLVLRDGKKLTFAVKQPQQGWTREDVPGGGGGKVLKWESTVLSDMKRVAIHSETQSILANLWDMHSPRIEDMFSADLEITLAPDGRIVRVVRSIHMDRNSGKKVVETSRCGENLTAVYGYEPPQELMEIPEEVLKKLRWEKK